MAFAPVNGQSGAVFDAWRVMPVVGVRLGLDFGIAARWRWLIGRGAALAAQTVSGTHDGKY